MMDIVFGSGGTFFIEQKAVIWKPKIVLSLNFLDLYPEIRKCLSLMVYVPWGAEGNSQASCSPLTATQMNFFSRILEQSEN